MDGGYVDDGLQMRMREGGQRCGGDGSGMDIHVRDRLLPCMLPKEHHIAPKEPYLRSRETEFVHTELCGVSGESAAKHTAAHCSALQYTAAHGSTRQHTAAHCNTLQHTATHCSTLQHNAKASVSPTLGGVTVVLSAVSFVV